MNSVPGPAAGTSTGELTVEGALRSAGLGPVLDAPVSQVLRSLGLPSLPAVPPLPPLPGLPPLPVLDLTALLKPLTDLLGAFGTADLAGAGDPSKIFSGLSTLLDLTVQGTTAALRAVDQVWTGAASTTAAAKMGKTAAETAMVSRQGSAMSVDITAAGGIVATGLAALQAVIVKTVGLVAATMPVIWTPPGQAAALAAIGAGLAEATAVVTATKVQLLAPTATMAANGAPVAVGGAPAAGSSPFGIAATVLDSVAGPLKAATGVLGSALAAGARGTVGAKAVKSAADRTGTRAEKDKSGNCRTDGQRDGATGLAGVRGSAVSGMGGGGRASGLGVAREVTAEYSARTPVPGGTEPAAVSVAPHATPGATATAGSGAAVAPMGAAGALGAHAMGRVVGGAAIVPRSDEAVADCDQTWAPAVFGDDQRPPSDPAADVDTTSERLAALKEELLS
ncbi:hypothetical protein GOARA_050_00160 [Gordonia araii NBRC 100433]|uniref:Uncharacterized protein n=1 Tax=Gordonia araii NBRC 100433 TaxID=1073574 RepID=G7H279_9ACTN|nr:hypothetical protein [Gordonia araii]NNG97493.1 hypothetical protein [Gordonia araii NBRC 100433]GAB09954.1 hypothetical protein GOARA_050_00160 [Gordonia araii NBRC 100433]